MQIYNSFLELIDLNYSTIGILVLTFFQSAYPYRLSGMTYESVNKHSAKCQPMNQNGKNTNIKGKKILIKESTKPQSPAMLKLGEDKAKRNILKKTKVKSNKV